MDSFNPNQTFDPEYLFGSNAFFEVKLHQKAI